MANIFTDLIVIYAGPFIFVLVSDTSVPAKADIAFVLDSSGSIGKENWKSVLQFVTSVISTLDIDYGSHRVGIASFGSYASIEFYLNDHGYLGDLIEAVDSIKWLDEMTNTSGGIRVMRKEIFNIKYGDRKDVPNIGIIMTDGESNRDRKLTQFEADQARKEGIILYVIGVGDEVDMSEVESVANDPNSDFLFLSRDFVNLDRIKAPLMQRVAKTVGKL